MKIGGATLLIFILLSCGGEEYSEDTLKPSPASGEAPKTENKLVKTCAHEGGGLESLTKNDFRQIILVAAKVSRQCELTADEIEEISQKMEVQ